MKLNKKLQTEILKVYHTGWDAYLRGDLKTYASCLSKDFKIIGTSASEQFKSRKEWIAYCKKTIDQFAGAIRMKNRKIDLAAVGHEVLVIENLDGYVLIEKKWTFYSKFRITTLMQKEKDGWKKIHQHGSLPDARANDGEVIATEQVKKENLQLKEAVKRRTIELESKNRELEIETALEKVRAIALGMKQPADMLDICKSIAQQLQLLGTHTIRNVQTAIFYEDRGIYMNYEYYARHDKTFITETSYTNHKIHLDFATQMLRGKDEFYHTHIAGKKKLNDWLAYQKTTNVFIDSFIETAKSLDYYWYSLGPVALGTSTYEPLTDEETSLFKRFLKVFELAYRRYLDIEKAEAQAREAQIETSLERVRAQAMAMHKSDELLNVCEVMYKELKSLGFDEIRNAMIHTFNANNDFFLDYDFSGTTGGKISQIPTKGFATVERYLEEIKKGSGTFLEMVLTGEELESWKNTRKATDQLTDPRLESLETLYYYYYSIGAGDIGISAFAAISEEKRQVLERFRNVFQLSYQRYDDIEKAEAQAREAQIEAALEKVRSRSLAMHHSDELEQVAGSLFDRIAELGLSFNGALIFIFDKEKRSIRLWIATNHLSAPVRIDLPYDEEIKDNEIFKDLWGAIENGKHILNKSFSGKTKDDYFRFVSKYNESKIPVSVRQLQIEKETWTACLAAEKNSVIGFDSWSGHLIKDEDFQIVQRFAKVFEQAFIRFLDLQKAEAQAREAQIEASLEKVRSRSLAMRNSQELQDVINTVFDRIRELEIDTDSAQIFIPGKNAEDVEFWIQNPQRNYSSLVTIPAIGNTKIGRDFSNAVIQGNDLPPTLYTKAEKDEFFSYYFEHSALGQLPVERKQLILTAEGYAFSFANNKNSGIAIGRYKNSPFTEKENDILKRFAKVFDQAYIRFLDLQKAEEQAKEAKIEASLERVRSKAMAMHNTQDLANTIGVFYKELHSYSITPIRCGVGLLHKKDRVGELFTWNTTAKGESLQLIGNLHMEGHPILNNVYESWLEQTEYHPVLRGNEIKEYYRVLRPQIEFPDYDKDEVQYGHFFFFKEGGVYAWTKQDMKEDELQIYRRFTTVLSLTYKRYKDLQQAEAQTRQAQIETAMEKVRARALAMQKPEELTEVARVLRKEMGLLGVEELEGSTIFIHAPDSEKAECWFAIKDESKPEKEMFADNIHMHLNDTWTGRALLGFFNSQEKQISIPVTGTHRQEWITYCYKLSPLFDGFYGTHIPDRTYHLYKFSNGAIGAAAPGEISPESWELLRRATSVFSLAYTRFSDLQKSEAQARLAIQRASLDRVRAETASMRTTSDLDKIIPMIWNELTTLGISFIRCGVFIMDNSREIIHTFLSTPNGEAIAAFHMPFSTPGNIADILGHWRQKETYIAHWNETDFTSFADTLVKQGVLTSTSEYLQTIPHGGFHLHFLPFLQGMLYVGNTTKLNEDQVELIQSVADAFSTAYARYEDFNRLEAAKQTVEKTLVDLKQTQKQLIQSEKMASLGELTAGIAHEIQNPLNFVNNFSEVNKELVEELKTELATGNLQLANEIANDLRENSEKINHHGKRADAIVKGMLQHSRSSNNQKEPTDINILCDEYLRLSYHGLRAKDKSFNATLKTGFDSSIGKINIIPQDIGRVILNLVNNAFYAVAEKKRSVGDGYEPTVKISTLPLDNMVKIEIGDNGNGIPESIVDKIFQPFFTTKPTGQGTGLGLSLSYDIVKAHGGELKVESKEGEGSSFILCLPTD